MRRALIPLLASAILLGGCVKTPTGSSTLDPSLVDTTQNITQSVCGFLPLAQTILNIFASGNPALTTGQAIAEAICKAVKPPAGVAGMAPMQGPPMVGAVKVEGRFVR